jgi:predicted transposase/invertase (TIGR01784 family)
MLRAVNDFVFKFIFGAEERKDLLLELVNSVLARVGLPLAAELELRNPFNPRHYYGDKESVIDIAARAADGRSFDIEMQLSPQKAYRARALYYWRRMYGGQLAEAEAYDELKPVIAIHFLDFVLDPVRPHFLKHFRLFDARDPVSSGRRPFSEDAEIIMLEMPRLPPLEDCGRLEKLCILLASEGGDRVMVEDLANQDEYFARIDAAYRLFHENPALWHEYEARFQGKLVRNTELKEAREAGLELGRAEGEIAARTETARRLKALGVDPAVIAQATGFMAAEIAALA